LNKPFRRVAVLKGGPSAEREVSLRSGAAVAGALRERGYEVTETDLKGMTVSIPDGVEAVFIALHGEFGEDGGVQAILDEKRIPYTGSGAAASRASFDKTETKKLLAEAGIPTPEYEIVSDGLRGSLPLPLVVKPARQGSSIGVTKVVEERQWKEAVFAALDHGGPAIAERYIEGREITVGILGREALPPVEIVAPGGWYDYASKYTAGACRYLAPAPLGEDIEREAMDLALRTFDALGCRGMGRVDFRLAPDGRLYVLEMNTIPGFTETSLLPKAAACRGIGFSELCDAVMRQACFGP